MAFLQKKSVTLSGHETSIALEAEFWAALRAMAQGRGANVSQLVRDLDQSRGDRPLASACRVAALAWALGRPQST